MRLLCTAILLSTLLLFGCRNVEKVGASQASPPKGASEKALSETPPKEAFREIEGIAFPKKVDAFSLVDVRNLPNNNLGLLLRYKNEGGLSADAYPYPSKPSQIDYASLDADAFAQKQYEKAIEGILIYEQRGHYENVRLISEKDVRVPVADSTVLGKHGVFTFVSHGEPKHSHLYVFTLPDHLLKIRATHPREMEAPVKNTLSDFAFALVRQMVSAP